MHPPIRIYEANLEHYASNDLFNIYYYQMAVYYLSQTSDDVFQ